MGSAERWRLRKVRPLALPRADHPRGAPHVSAASALVRVGHRLHAVADDELHLASFGTTPRSPLALTRLFAGRLPQGAAARKRRKPDLEALVRLPAFEEGAAGEVLLAIGSGSRPSREQGAWMGVDGHTGELLGAATVVDLAPLYARLRSRHGDLNIEAAFRHGDELRLLHRAHGGDPRNACLGYSWQAMAAFLRGAGAPPEPLSTRLFDLGRIAGVPWGWTDATALGSGGWAFAAVAEATDDAYADGTNHGSAIGIVDAHDRLVSFETVSRRWKVEGIAEADGPAGGFWLTSDADDPDQPSWLLRATRRR